MERLFNALGERNHCAAFKADVKKMVQWMFADTRLEGFRSLIQSEFDEIDPEKIIKLPSNNIMKYSVQVLTVFRRWANKIRHESIVRKN